MVGFNVCIVSGVDWNCVFVGFVGNCLVVVIV